MPTYEEDLIKRARELQRLATQRRKLRRQLKAVDLAIKHAKKFLNAIRHASQRRPNVAPNRLDGGASGFLLPEGNLRDGLVLPDLSTRPGLTEGLELEPMAVSPISPVDRAAFRKADRDFRRSCKVED